jgi:hypothetical protein
MQQTCKEWLCRLLSLPLSRGILELLLKPGRIS